MKKIGKVLILLISLNNCSYVFNLKNFNKQSADNMENDQKNKCYNCEGKGKAKCPRCKGGKQLHNFTLRGHELIKCERCEGKGFSKCDQCDGNGIYKEGNILKKILIWKYKKATNFNCSFLICLI